MTGYAELCDELLEKVRQRDMQLIEQKRAAHEEWRRQHKQILEIKAELAETKAELAYWKGVCDA